MPEVKPNTVKACNVRIDNVNKTLQKYISDADGSMTKFIKDQSELAAMVEVLAQEIHDQRKRSQPSEDAQKKAVESARCVTQSTILAKLRDELNGQHTSTLRALRLAEAFALTRR